MPHESDDRQDRCVPPEGHSGGCGDGIGFQQSYIHLLLSLALLDTLELPWNLAFFDFFALLRPFGTMLVQSRQNLLECNNRGAADALKDANAAKVSRSGSWIDLGHKSTWRISGLPRVPRV